VPCGPFDAPDGLRKQALSQVVLCHCIAGEISVLDKSQGSAAATTRVEA